MATTIKSNLPCPKCRNTDNYVTDARGLPWGHGIRRRRQCKICDYRFSTIETLAEPGLHKRGNTYRATKELIYSDINKLYNTISMLKHTIDEFYGEQTHIIENEKEDD